MVNLIILSFFLMNHIWCFPIPAQHPQAVPLVHPSLPHPSPEQLPYETRHFQERLHNPKTPPSPRPRHPLYNYGPTPSHSMFSSPSFVYRETMPVQQQHNHRSKPNHVLPPLYITYPAIMRQYSASTPILHHGPPLPPQHRPVPLTQHLVVAPPYTTMPAISTHSSFPRGRGPMLLTTSVYPGLLPRSSPSYPMPPIHSLPGYQYGFPGLLDEDDDLGFMDDYLQTHLAAGLGVYGV